MSSILFKKLVEVRILHDYYLSGYDELSFFDLNETNRLARLNMLLKRGQYDIRKDLSIEPTRSTKRFLKNHKIHLLYTPTGFFLAAEVEPVNDGGMIKYRTKIPFEAQESNWQFTINTPNPQFENFTNYQDTREISSGYFLTNRKPPAINKTYPSLAMPISGFSMGETYEMGALSYIGGTLKQAWKQTASASSGWVDLPQDNHWVNEGDKHLLSTRFRYSVVDPGVNEAAFLLSDQDGNLITEVSTSDEDIISVFDENNDLREVILDFTEYEDGIGNQVPLTEGAYTLEVMENGTLSKTFALQLYNDLSMGMAGILLDPGEPDPDYALIDANGYLVRRPDGTHPVFEIRFKNRITYWRYYSTTSNVLEAKNKATLFLDASVPEGFLITKEPKSLQQEPVYFVDGSDQVFLPNPTNFKVKSEADGRLYSDIFLSELKGLIENKT